MSEVARPGKVGYVKRELIYTLDGRPTPQYHTSTIEETPSGLVATWFGGSHEKHPDVGIWLSRTRAKGGRGQRK